MTMRQLAEATDYDGLIAAIRNRAAELQVAGETLDEISGLPNRYCAKLIGPKPIRRLGAISLGPSLGALALKLIVVEDSEALRRVAGRLRKRDSRRVRNSVVHVTRTKREFQKMGRIGGPLSRTYMSKERASEIGRKAAQARWSKPRVAQVKGSAAKNISRAVAARDRQRKAV
jgi:hypothetical protein